MTTQFTLPRDADEREIPLDTAYMYNRYGHSIEITRWCFTTRLEPLFADKNKWIAIDKARSVLDPTLLHLTPPDSWEKLEEDLDRVVRNEDYDIFDTMACAYTNQNGDTCEDCRFCGNHNTRCCLNQMVEDITSRINNLRNED